MSVWPNNLPAPVFGGDNTRIARIMSAMVVNGKVPDFRAALYAMEQAQDASDLNYSEGFRFKYDGAALGAD